LKAPLCLDLFLACLLFGFSCHFPFSFSCQLNTPNRHLHTRGSASPQLCCCAALRRNSPAGSWVSSSPADGQ
jgi:hypothetical protein